MIDLILVADPPAAVSTMTPDEFRRSVRLHSVCITETPTEAGGKELAELYVEPGENLPNVALGKTAGQPPMFEQGSVTSVKTETEAAVTSLVAVLQGQRGGRPAQLRILFPTKWGESVRAILSQDNRDLRFECIPDIPPPSRR